MAGHRMAENRAGMDRTHPMTALPMPPAMVNHHISLAMEMATNPPTAPLTNPATAVIIQSR
jgi:hypothetical protein